MECAGPSGTVTRDDQRSYIKIETLRNKTPSQIHQALREACADQAVDRSTVSRWATRFRSGRESVNDDPRSGRPKSSTDERHLQLVAEQFADDRRVTCSEIAEAIGISAASVFRILTEDLKKRKICARWVPHCLTPEQKLTRLKTSTLLQQRFTKEGEAFLHRIIAIDETWIRDFEPELKSQSNEWRGPGSPRPKKFRRAQAKVKQMMIFAYDHKGIILADRVPCGTSVTAAYYRSFLQSLNRKLHKIRPELLIRGPLILHDNARPHIANVVTDQLRKFGWEVLPHPAYSPDLSPPDFDLFPKLKAPMRGHRFASLKELSQNVTQAIRRINKDGSLTGIQDLPKRWLATIAKQGDYIEGL